MRAIYVSPNQPPGRARLAQRPIREVMTKNPICVTGDDLLEEALTCMIRTGLRHLVVSGEGGRCVGILSDRSIAAAWASDYAVLAHNRVRSAIDLLPAVVSVAGTVADAARLMQTTGVDAVAVIDEAGAAVGVITGSDLVALLAG